MAKENQDNQDNRRVTIEEQLGNVVVPGGLNTDASLVNQPQGTTRFVFTGVDETKEGDLGTISTEESNEQCYDFTVGGDLAPGYIPIGKVYVGEENTVLFLANPNGNSAIVIADKECTLTIAVTDENQSEKLGFKITQQIDATFRLRRGCERTIYWVDPKPRIFTLDKEEEFKVTDPLDSNFGNWDISKFNLFKTYKSIPEFSNIEVVDGAGVLPAGSYNFSIRYLDADFNPTEFITSTETIMIYNSPLTSSYRNIEGNTKEEAPYYGFSDSNKAIKIDLVPSTLDLTYPFYQIAITEANAGSGLITETKYSAPISTRQPNYTYTGTNFESLGDQQEVTMFNNIIEKATSIEQIENRLILGDIEGDQINYCNLQKYASKVTADMLTKDVFVSVADFGNSKDPAAHFHGIGYMPGEIYSFGIVYIFEDNTVSPVFHLPGKSPLDSVGQMYSTGSNVYPMTNVNNRCETTKYIDNNTCGTDLFWGKDHKGQALTNQFVRHHRFPLRSDYNIPFVEKLSQNNIPDNVQNIILKATRTGAQIPLVCPEDDPGCSGTQAANFGDPAGGAAFEILVDYTEDAVNQSFSAVLDPLEYEEEVGFGSSTANVEYVFNSGNIFGNVINVITLTEVFEDPLTNNVVTLVLGTNPLTNLQEYTGTSSVTGLIYTLTIQPALAGFEENLYKATVFGIRFSNILLPDPVDTNNKAVTGYYIVRNERKELDKSVLDSAVLLPTTKEKNFAAQGLIFPQYQNLTVENSRLKKDFLGFISPEHKFNNRQYATFSEVIQQGEFKKIDVIQSRVKINDVAEGSGYVKGKHKKGESDLDGFSLHIKTRDNITEFVPKKNFAYDSTDIKEVFYLNALEDRLAEDSVNNNFTLFNLAADNKIGILTLNQNYTEFNPITELPYVYLFRNITEPYANFRLEPYYKESKNPHKFIGSTPTSCDIFNGDTYINSMRYVNSIFYDTRMKKRKGKTNVFGFILGAILIVAAVVATIFSFGATSPLLAAALAVGAGLAAGVGTTLLISGVTQEAWNRAYNLYYKQGLRTTITDYYLTNDTDLVSGQSRGNLKNPSDDEVQWLGDCVNLWFESSINMGLRHGFNDATPSYLKAPGLIEQGTTYPEWNREYFGIDSVGSGNKKIDGGTRHEDVSPTTALDNHMTAKLTFLDASKKSGRSYYGIALAEVYFLNPDYTRRNKQKAYFHLGLEYDCCSDCTESFPHRWHWSEQSFQEELTDNFRTFLPNNYKDLEAETGKISDIFRISNNLYIHTEEGLWFCPQTFQERVTGDILSFIGTGEYFSVPPRKIVDDNNSSAGNRHKWARLKTKYGVLFPSWKEKKWYMFNGEQLQPISDLGNSSYFRNNMDFLVEDQYYAVNKERYPYSNNPSNQIGVGFISTYDTTKERLIVTKKDYRINNLPTKDPYLLCAQGDNLIFFNDVAQTIADKEADGWTYIGVEDCKLKFKKVEEVVETITVDQVNIVEIPSDLDIYVFYDTSGSFGYSKAGRGLLSPSELTTLITPTNTNVYFPQMYASLMDWINNDLIPSGWTGSGPTPIDSVYHYYDNTERWIDYPSSIPLVSGSRGKALIISFCNESAEGPATPPAEYHGVMSNGINFNNPTQPATQYVIDYNNFINNVHPTFELFIGINYPIATTGDSRPFVLHSLAAIKGADYTLAEVNALPQNLFFSTSQWETLKSQLQTNPYSSLLDSNNLPGLEQWGWLVKADRSTSGNPAFGACESTIGTDIIISPCQFSADMDEFLQSALQIEREEIQIDVVNFQTEVDYIEGALFIPEIVNNSWTMSFSLKRQEWRSWHPYLPSFYFHVQEKFYSWLQGNRYLWRHNRPGHYRTFYGVTYPFIVECVDNPVMLGTKVWNNVIFQSEAKVFNNSLKTYNDILGATFNKVLFYNTEQISGVLDITNKANQSSNYLLQQTQSNISSTSILIDRNERDWSLNDMRDIRIDTNVPMFIKDIGQLQSVYYIDKIVNSASISYSKSWNELESFRDKFLVTRLIFDTFDTNTQLIFYYATFNKVMSER